MKVKYFLTFSVFVSVACLMVALFTSPVRSRAASIPASGSISGKITYTGTPPKMKPIDMSKEPSCAKQHNPPINTENVSTGPGNTLEYVVVYISSGDQGSVAPSANARYDQKGCQYVPHVLAFQANQNLEIYNDDQTSHNIHPLAKVNAEWNKSQPPGTPPLQAKYEKPEFIPVKCNIHPWMHGYFVVLGTSHYAISDKDGEYKITDVPAGTYKVTAWQEQYSPVTQDVTVAAGGTKTADFSFKVLPY